MNAVKILEIVFGYREDFIRNDIPAIHFPHGRKPITDTDVLTHCHWMLDDIEKFAQKAKLKRPKWLPKCIAELLLAVPFIKSLVERIEKSRLGKAKRWLGFMQGCLWSVRWYTIDELRDQNKPNLE